MTSVTAIIDSRAPQKAIDTMRKYCNVFLFHSENSTYDAIACHPDVFLFQGIDSLIVAPNTPQNCIDLLQIKNCNYIFGESAIGSDLRNSTPYNCIETEKNLFHKVGFTDSQIVKTVVKPMVALPQAYTRCSMFALNENAFITSDKGIEKALLQNGFSCFYCDPQGIVLPPYNHGFIGGCMGMWDKRLFVIGSLNHLKDGNKMREFINAQNLELVELYDGQLYDGGGIFFL